MSGRTAMFVKEAKGFHGDAAVYRLNPPIETGPFVIANTIEDTLVFSSDGEKVTHWGVLGAVSHKSHADALADMGYDLVKAAS